MRGLFNYAQSKRREREGHAERQRAVESSSAIISLRRMLLSHRPNRQKEAESASRPPAASPATPATIDRHAPIASLPLALRHYETLKTLGGQKTTLATLENNNSNRLLFQTHQSFHLRANCSPCSLLPALEQPGHLVAFGSDSDSNSRAGDILLFPG